MGLRRVLATRYVAPLREGGSLPALVEADDDGLYVMKFRGAGQGPGALVAEVVAGELARALGLPVPELVLAQLDPELARAEPDVEIQELARASAGTNLGVDFLPGALSFSPAAAAIVEPQLAAAVVWFDALVMNVDRTPHNPNIIEWHGRPWLIDHGAALYLQHGNPGLAGVARAPFPQVADHVLLDRAAAIPEADARLAPVAANAASAVTELVPDAWLGDDPPRRRADLAAFLRARLEAPRAFAAEAEAARAH